MRVPWSAGPWGWARRKSPKGRTGARLHWQTPSDYLSSRCRRTRSARALEDRGSLSVSPRLPRGLTGMGCPRLPPAGRLSPVATGKERASWPVGTFGALAALAPGGVAACSWRSAVRLCRRRKVARLHPAPPSDPPSGRILPATILHGASPEAGAGGLCSFPYQAEGTPLASWMQRARTLASFGNRRSYWRLVLALSSPPGPRGLDGGMTSSGATGQLGTAGKPAREFRPSSCDAADETRPGWVDRGGPDAADVWYFH